MQDTRPAAPIVGTYISGSYISRPATPLLHSPLIRKSTSSRPSTTTKTLPKKNITKETLPSPWEKDDVDPFIAATSSSSVESYRKSIENPRKTVNNRLNIHKIFGDEGIRILQGTDLDPSSVVALRVMFIVCEAVLKLQAAFRARLAIKRLYRETAASAAIQRWFRNARVCRHFRRILEMVRYSVLKKIA
jgi:hypothetical protein